ncbi:MAG: PcfB family protein [Christensenella sp.]
MNHSGDAADQIVNMTVRGVEVAANMAGKAALTLATFLIAAIKSQKRSKGRTRMMAFNGKPTKVFVIKSADMKIFAEEARKYGVLFAAVVNKKQPDGLIDVVVNANDAAKVQRISERFALSTVDVEKIRKDIEQKRQKKQEVSEQERVAPEAQGHTIEDNMLDEMLGEQLQQKQPIEVEKENPTTAGTAKSNPSAPISVNKEIIDEAGAERQKPSVRAQLKEMREERKTKTELKPLQKARARQTVHKQLKRKRKAR